MNNLQAAIDLQPTHLQNHLIRLVPLQEGDFEQLYGVASDPAIWEQHPQKDRYKRNVFQTFFESAVQSGGAFLILDNLTGKCIGSSRYYDYNGDEKTIAIGYTFLAKEYWGGNYNGALKTLMLRHIFQYVDAVVLHIGPHNIRSQKAALKVGARKKEGNYFDANGDEQYEYIIHKEAYLNKSFN